MPLASCPLTGLQGCVRGDGPHVDLLTDLSARRRVIPPAGTLARVACACARVACTGAHAFAGDTVPATVTRDLGRYRPPSRSWRNLTRPSRTWHLRSHCLLAFSAEISARSATVSG